LSVSAGSALATLTLHRRLLMLRACGAAWDVREKQSACYRGHDETLVWIPMPLKGMEKSALSPAPLPLAGEGKVEKGSYFKTATIMLIVILRVAKRVILREVAGRRIQTLHGFRDDARNDGEPRSFIA
ncbi:MAG: hypothetical protein FWC35_00850, partial [Proteobacteria bacterium]|nr:hypothetical protein [Pseudomonadota bacterium]